MRYFLTFSYDGTAYHGWQRQPNALGVQEVLDGALTTLLRQPVATVGAGRTDAGVHASCMVAHFDADVADEAWLADKLNRLLPPDIAISGVRRVRPEAHARFDAVRRTYHYHVYMRKDPFQRHFATRLFVRPDFDRMNEAAAWLCGVEDFTSFSKLHSDAKTNICHVSQAEWVDLGDGTWRFVISADRFLRGMVRAVVGTLFEVGRGRMDLGQFRSVVEARNRCAAGDSVPACALSLVEVAYPPEVYQV